MMVQSKASLIPAKKGLLSDQGRKLRRVLFFFFLFSVFSSERDPESTMLSSDKRNLKND